MDLKLLSGNGQKNETVSASDALFGREYNEALVHQVVVAYQANARQGTRAQKGRSDLKLASLRRDRELVQLARDAAFEIVDSDPHLDHHPLLLDEINLVLSAEDEEFLFKS